MTTEASTVAPVTKAARVESLDVLRGIAVLGILAMNITAFGLLWQAYSNPLVAGGYTGANKIAYDVISIGFEGTMRGIFSLLFGAGIVLLTERMEKSGAGIMAAEVHFRRMLWMMLAGVIHWALLLWTGEILFAYSICGMLLFALRKLSVRVQLIMAGVLLIAAALMTFGQKAESVDAKAKAEIAMQAKAAGSVPSDEQTEAIETWEGIASHTTPTARQAKEQVAWHEGSYGDAVSGQLPGSYEFQWIGLPGGLFFDMIPFMLIGMALLKLGVLGGQKPAKTYLLMMLGGYAVGVPLGLYELDLLIAGNFAPLAFVDANLTYQFSRLAMVVGHLGLVLLAIRSGVARPLQRALAAVGQMALSNYLTQTLICTGLFYSFGFGFGLFGKLERHELYLVVFAIWAAQLVWSPLWLKYFRFGPFEWLWRSLTYWQRQPMRLVPRSPAAETVAVAG
jgi:uncharacterized protein